MNEEIATRLDDLASIQSELESILQTLVLNDSTIIDALAQMLSTLQQMQLRAERAQNRLAETNALLAHEVRSVALAMTELCGEQRLPAIVGAGVERAQADPEVSLLEYLQPFIDDTTAIDVGANAGDVSERLLSSGYRVFAFEPYEPTFRSLSDRLGERAQFRAFQLAIGDSDGQRLLHIAEDFSEDCSLNPSLFHTLAEHPTGHSIRFTGTTPVEVRSLESLRRAGCLPGHAGILKIDTEGYDVEVINGPGEMNVSVIMAEFWDAEHDFGKNGHGRLEKTVSALKARGFLWYIVVYRPHDGGPISYYLNRAETFQTSWGNALFFCDRSLFMKAARWCEAALSPTFFR